jgi:predicted transcriptional regulator
MTQANLSEYQLSILNNMIPALPSDNFNLLELVSYSASGPLTFARVNDKMQESYAQIRRYLLDSGFIVQRKETECYSLTPKGSSLKKRGTLEKHFESEIKKSKHPILCSLF